MKYYDFKGDYYEGRARVKQDGRWFFIDLEACRYGNI